MNTVKIPGILRDESKQFIHVIPAVNNVKLYNRAKVYVDRQGDDELTFIASFPPLELRVYVIIEEMKNMIAQTITQLPNTLGIEWKSSSITKTNNVEELFYANGIWLSIIDEKMCYSEDNCKTWSTSNISGRYGGIAYGNGVYVYVSYGKVYYSNNGKNWTLSFQSDLIYNFNSVLCFGNEIFVIQYLKDDVFDAGIQYSTNGKDWTVVKTDKDGNEIGRIYQLSHCNNVFIVSSYDNGSFYSTNGEVWSKMNVTYDFANIAYNNGIYIGSDDYGIYKTNSLNGSWSKVYTSDEHYSFYIVCYNGIWFALGSNGMLRSINGTSWSSITTSTLASSSLCYGEGIYIACYNDEVYRSINGSSWSVIDGITSDIVCYGNGTFCIGSDKKGIWYSN